MHSQNARADSQDDLALPPSFDYIDLGELLDVIEELSDWMMIGTLHERPGERDAFDRAARMLARYRPATVDTS